MSCTGLADANEVMPESNVQGIDVSKEEERYLRRAFRRFALPYVVVFAAVAWVTTTAVSRDEQTDSPEAVSALREELGDLKELLAALESRVEKVGSEVEKAGRRVGALESQKPGRQPTGDTSALERELRDANRRVSQLEKRVADDAAAERIDALAARMRRIEESARQASTAAPAPAAPAAPPAPSR